MAARKTDWDKIRGDYLTTNIQDGKSISIGQLCRKYKVVQTTMYQRSCKEKWADKLERLRKAKYKKIMEAVTNEVVKADSQHLLGEVRVRIENFHMATSVIDPLLEEWKERTKNKKRIRSLTTAELINGISVCLRARKEAAGIASVIQVDGKLDIQYLDGEIPIEVSQNRFARYATLAEKLNQSLAGKKRLPSRQVRKH